MLRGCGVLGRRDSRQRARPRAAVGGRRARLRLRPGALRRARFSTGPETDLRTVMPGLTRIGATLLVDAGTAEDAKIPMLRSSAASIKRYAPRPSVVVGGADAVVSRAQRAAADHRRDLSPLSLCGAERGGAGSRPPEPRDALGSAGQRSHPDGRLRIMDRTPARRFRPACPGYGPRLGRAGTRSINWQGGCAGHPLISPD